MDDYTTTDPAEFFAVLSRYYFMPSSVLHHYCAEVYEHLSAYCRQQPWRCWAQ